LAIHVLDKWGKELDCQTCDEKLREERGHDKEGIIPFLVDGERIFRCPLMLVNKMSWDYIRAYSYFKDGILPNGTGWANESNKFNEAMTILGNEIKSKEDDGRKKT
jgi:hypothetical protein